jgi:alkanesulfonate monooxygenase SsuD/methylene tetrahydromethanopterin reductase-like flavin-dependent oxidoreductase (luciferase family)
VLEKNEYEKELRMKYGFVFPGGDAPTAVDFARAAEAAGWDGFFMWEPVWGIDPWVTLAAIAAVTDHIRLGTMLTPVSRRRPWKLASETVTLDRLSHGRVILSVGLGAIDTGFEEFGEETDRKIRAALLDEGLDIITGLWQGQPFNYEGKHYQVKGSDFDASPWSTGHDPFAPSRSDRRDPAWCQACHRRW